MKFLRPFAGLTVKGLGAGICRVDNCSIEFSAADWRHLYRLILIEAREPAKWGQRRLSRAALAAWTRRERQQRLFAERQRCVGVRRQVLRV